MKFQNCASQGGQRWDPQSLGQQGSEDLALGTKSNGGELQSSVRILPNSPKGCTWASLS